MQTPGGEFDLKIIESSASMRKAIAISGSPNESGLSNRKHSSVAFPEKDWAQTLWWSRTHWRDRLPGAICIAKNRLFVTGTSEIGRFKHSSLFGSSGPSNFDSSPLSGLADVLEWPHTLGKWSLASLKKSVECVVQSVREKVSYCVNVGSETLRCFFGSLVYARLFSQSFFWIINLRHFAGWKMVFILWESSWILSMLFFKSLN